MTTITKTTTSTITPKYNASLLALSEYFYKLKILYSFEIRKLNFLKKLMSLKCKNK